MNISHRMPVEIGFKHCDPAGIVFYPRYVEMLNDTVEHWFKHGLKIDFASLHGPRSIATPLVNLQVDFLAPSRLGEDLVSVLTVSELGRSSVKLSITLEEEGVDKAPRLQAKLVLVFISMTTMRPIPIPDDIRAAMGCSAAAASDTGAC